MLMPGVPNVDVDTFMDDVLLIMHEQAQRQRAMRSSRGAGAQRQAALDDRTLKKHECRCPNTLLVFGVRVFVRFFLSPRHPHEANPYASDNPTGTNMNSD